MSKLNIKNVDCAFLPRYSFVMFGRDGGIGRRAGLKIRWG